MRSPPRRSEGWNLTNLRDSSCMTSTFLLILHPLLRSVEYISIWRKNVKIANKFLNNLKKLK
jgi:hypothetical protein